MTIEEESASARSGGFFYAWRALVKRQFWGGHPNTFRGLFAWSSLSYALFMIVQPAAFQHPGYTLMRFLFPVWVWAFLFFLHWLAITYIVFRHPGVAFQLCVNVFGFVMWAGYVTLQDLSLGYFALNSSAERVMVLYSVWALLRTAMGRRSDN